MRYAKWPKYLGEKREINKKRDLNSVYWHFFLFVYSRSNTELRQRNASSLVAFFFVLSSFITYLPSNCVSLASLYLYIFMT